MNYKGKAFISCSVRNEDAKFVDFVERILKSNSIEPIGTVGWHSVSPVPIADGMKGNMGEADFLVVVATPRYFQKDIVSGVKKNGVSEMIHVESGMAHMANILIVVFVKEGTDVGSFLPGVTQYITLSGELDDFYSKLNHIRVLLDNVWAKALENDKISLGKVLLYGLAGYGLYKFLKGILLKEEE